MFSDGPAVDQMQLEKEKEPQPSTSGGQSSRSALEIDAPIRDDGFGGNLGQDIIAGGLFEGGLFDDAPMPPEVPAVETSSVLQTEEPEKPAEEVAAHDSDDDMGDHFGGPPSVGGQRYCLSLSTYKSGLQCSLHLLTLYSRCPWS